MLKVYNNIALIDKMQKQTKKKKEKKQMTKNTRTYETIATVERERERERVTFSSKGFICDAKNIIEENKIGNVNKFRKKEKFNWQVAYLFGVCLLI